MALIQISSEHGLKTLTLNQADAITHSKETPNNRHT